MSRRTFMGQVMAECDCNDRACEVKGYCMVERIEVLEAALARIANIMPHRLGETPNEYHMREAARAAIAALKGQDNEVS